MYLDSLLHSKQIHLTSVFSLVRGLAPSFNTLRNYSVGDRDVWLSYDIQGRTTG